MSAEDTLTFERFSEMNRRRCESYTGFGESLQPSSRGWGRIAKLPDAEELQDTVGGFIADALTEYWRTHRPGATQTKGPR